MELLLHFYSKLWHKIGSRIVSKDKTLWPCPLLPGVLLHARFVKRVELLPITGEHNDEENVDSNTETIFKDIVIIFP